MKNKAVIGTIDLETFAINRTLSAYVQIWDKGNVITDKRFENLTVEQWLQFQRLQRVLVSSWRVR